MASTHGPVLPWWQQLAKKRSGEEAAIAKRLEALELTAFHAEDDVVTGPQLDRIGDPSSVQGRAVGRAEVADDESSSREQDAAVVAGNAFLVDLDFALWRAADDHGFSADVNAASHLVSVNDDQDAALNRSARLSRLPDVGEDGLAGAGALVFERHAFNIPRAG